MKHKVLSPQKPHTPRRRKHFCKKNPSKELVLNARLNKIWELGLFGEMMQQIEKEQELKPNHNQELL